MRAPQRKRKLLLRIFFFGQRPWFYSPKRSLKQIFLGLFTMLVLNIFLAHRPCWESGWIYGSYSSEKKCTHIQMYIILLSSQSERVHIFPEAHLWVSLTISGPQIKSTSSKSWEPNIERCIRSEKVGYIT